MSFVQSTLLEFSNSLGMDDALTLNQQGVVSLAIESLGTLFIEQLTENLLVYLVVQHERLSADLLLSAAEMCHWRHNNPCQVNVAVGGDQSLVFATKIRNSELNLPALESSIELLGNLHEQVQQTVRS